MLKKCMVITAILSFLFAGLSFAAEEVLFGFETGPEGWEIPDWAYEKPDHVQEAINISEEFASEGVNSLEVEAVFPGGRWAGAMVETMQYFDWSDAKALACDIYLPADAPTGLKAKIILTVGDNWQWVEMSRSFDVVPGEWITVEADISPGSIDWRRVEVGEAFRQDIRKVSIRVESNNKPAYAGAFYIDNVRLIK
jgi:hypothetical protein